MFRSNQSLKLSNFSDFNRVAYYYSFIDQKRAILIKIQVISRIYTAWQFFYSVMTAKSHLILILIGLPVRPMQFRPHEPVILYTQLTHVIKEDIS